MKNTDRVNKIYGRNAVTNSAEKNIKSAKKASRIHLFITLLYLFVLFILHKLDVNPIYFYPFHAIWIVSTIIWLVSILKSRTFVKPFGSGGEGPIAEIGALTMLLGIVVVISVVLIFTFLIKL